MTLVRTLDSVSLADALDVGGKSARLGMALSLGAPVLPGVVLTTSLYRRFMRQGGLQGEIASILASMQPRAITHFQAAEWAIRSAFSVRRVPRDVVDAIRDAWRSLGGVPVAVRSSATNEDSPQQSFVGQHDTYLDIDTEDAAMEAVLGCWMSLYSAKALAYARSFGVDLLSSSMGVLMQPMVQPTMRGALFTANPITGNPASFVLEVRDGPDAGVHVLDPYERKPGEKPTWSQLRRLGLRLDEHHVAYQAVEWAMADEQLYLMRVRPLTHVPRYLPREGLAITARGEDIELVAEPTTAPRAILPFFWYHRSRIPAMNRAHQRSRNPLFGLSAVSQDHFVCGYRYRCETAGRDVVTWRGPLRRRLLGLERILAARNIDRPFRNLVRYELQQLVAVADTDLSLLSTEELADLLRRTTALCDAFWEEHGRLSGVSSVFRELFCRVHEAWLGAEPDCETLLWEVPEVPLRWEDALSDLTSERDGQQLIESIATLYGHLFIEGEPLAPWRDICTLQPSREAIEHWVASQSQTNQDGKRIDRTKDYHVRRRERALEERRVVGHLGRLRRVLYRRLLRLGRRFVPLEEQLDVPVILGRLLECRIVRQVGARMVATGLTGQDKDACLLGVQEILNWLDGEMDHDELVRLVLERKDLWRRWARYSPPQTISLQPKVSADDSAPENGEHVLHGRAVSSGVGSGRARVVNSLGEAADILPGEVLVCREPLFELSPLFAIVSAVVAEQGGLLDHASVLAREYAVPAVFAVAQATRVIREGEHLTVDAQRGVVVRQRREAEWSAY